VVQAFSGRVFTLDDLLALNDEIAALVRAGVPLESGLAELGRELPGPLDRVAATLAKRLADGESLDQALLASQAEFPQLYISVVTAGLKSGKLAAALEGLAAAARRVAELRQVTVTAMIYPLIVFLLGWTMFVGFVTFFAPHVLPGFRDFQVSSAGLVAWFADLGHSARWWAPIGPLLVLMGIALWWSRSRRALALGSSRWMGWVPGARRLLKLCHWATFTDVLALLIDQRVPLPEGVRLAAAASGDRVMELEAQRLAAALEQGASPTECLHRAQRFPPLIAWFLSAAQEERLLALALRHAATSYHQRARQRAEVVQTLLPTFLTLFVGGTTVLVYALLVFAPWANLLKTIADL
jgi:type II secretory pathway component PulF